MKKPVLTEEEEKYLKIMIAGTLEYFSAVMEMKKMKEFITGSMEIDGYKYTLRIDKTKAE